MKNIIKIEIQHPLSPVMKNKIISEFPITKKNKRKAETWYCTVCGEDMGEINPRQYCCKTYCPYEI